MNLLEFLKANGSVRFAKQLGWSLQYLYQIKKGMRPVPVRHCVAIERATGGQVTRKDLRPNDWTDIWPELAEKGE